MTRGLARSLAKDRITVNAVSPGAADTAMMRSGMTEEALQAVTAQIPLGYMARAERDGGHRRVPRLRPCRLHHRRDDQCQRRLADVLNARLAAARSTGRRRHGRHTGAFEGKAAVVTGAARGIGEAIAHRSSATRARRCSRSIRSRPRRRRTGSAISSGDVADAASVAAAFAAVDARGRPARRAGQQCRHPARRARPARWAMPTGTAVIDTHLTGMFLCAARGDPPHAPAAARARSSRSPRPPASSGFPAAGPTAPPRRGS